MSRLAHLGQAQFEAKVENKFLAGSSPAPRITQKNLSGDGGIGRRKCKSIETIKLRLFQEVENIG